MNLNDFDFLLPEKLIALRPVRPRTSSRLLVAKSGSFIDASFFQLKLFLRPGDRLVFNNTKVFTRSRFMPLYYSKVFGMLFEKIKPPYLNFQPQ